MKTTRATRSFFSILAVLLSMICGSSALAQEHPLPPGAIAPHQSRFVTEPTAGAESAAVKLPHEPTVFVYPVITDHGPQFGFVVDGGFVPVATKIIVGRQGRTLLRWRWDESLTKVISPRIAFDNAYHQFTNRMLPRPWPVGQYDIVVRVYPLVNGYWEYQFSLTLASFGFWNETCIPGTGQPRVSLRYHLFGKIPAGTVRIDLQDNGVLVASSTVAVHQGIASFDVGQNLYQNSISGRWLDTTIVDQNTSEAVKETLWYPVLSDVPICASSGGGGKG